MLSRQILLQAAAAIAISAVSAIAQASPAGDRHDGDHARPDMAAWHQQMCTDRYARHVGDMAYLETKLTLNDSQQALFAQWKDSVLSNAKSHESECLAHTAHFDHAPSFIDRETRMHDMLQARLAEMDSERPTVTALYQSLSSEQKQVFDMMGSARHGHGYGGGGWRHHGPGEHGDHMQGDHDQG